MSGEPIVHEVSGQGPSLQAMQEFEELLAAFGVAHDIYRTLPDAAKVFLVGQYLEVHRGNDVITALRLRLAQYERDLARIRGQRDAMRVALDKAGIPLSPAGKPRPAMTYRTPLPEGGSPDETRLG